MKLAVLTMRLFDEPRTGGELCTARLLRNLEQAGHELTVMGLGPAPCSGSRRVRFISVGNRLPAFDDMSKHQRMQLPIRALLHGRALTTQRLHGPDSITRLRNELHTQLRDLDALVVDHLQPLDWVRPMLHRLPPPMVVMHNMEADCYLELAQAVPGHSPKAQLRRWMLRREARLLRRLERAALTRGSVVGCLSPSDANRLRTLAQRFGAAPPVEVLPGYTLPLPPAATHAGAGLTPADLRARLAALPAGRRRIGMIGTWTWAPNRAGLQWMVEQVLPQMPANCQLVLAGSGLEHLPVPPRTTVLGRIADVASFYEAVDLVAIPSHSGSGVQEKVIEAIGTGLPVVATAHALRGLLPQLPQQLHVAEGAPAFAQACAQLPLTRDPAAGEAWATQRVQLYREALHRCLSAASSPRPARALQSLVQQP